MPLKKEQSILVIFGQEIPHKGKNWWNRFDEVVAPNSLKENIEKRGLFFIGLEELVEPGSVKEAYELVNNLSKLTLADGTPLPKLIKYQNYELWWIHYDDLMQKFCLLYLQYRNLLKYLKHFSKIYLYQSHSGSLFKYFLSAHGCQCFDIKKSILRRLLPIPPGILIQILLSFLFLLWLKITRPKVMVWTSDRFDPPYYCDFRMKHIYEELRKRKIPFVEFIRSQESLPVLLKHALKRKRPVVYSAAIITFLHFLSHWLPKRNNCEIVNLNSYPEIDPEKKFWFSVATHYLKNNRGTIYSIQVMRFILKWIGVRTAFVPLASSRTFHEVLACKIENIKTVGIQHGIPKYYLASDFMPNFDGEKLLSVDKYGVWSEWWKEYYISHSRAYQPEQLYVSGHMRPLERKIMSEAFLQAKEEPIKVLFVSEQLAVPSEVMPYLLELLKTDGISIYLKFRSYRDGFEDWIKTNHPEILNRVEILYGDMHQAISKCEVVVGCHSTGVLEALLQLKPPIFFRTQKWGDYLELKDFGSQNKYFAENPEELVRLVKENVIASKEDLKRLRERFFGDPYQNGSKWVVDQLEENLCQRTKEKY
ncbi:MAG: hypothetical protein QME61_01945 [Patescibacteria group bacterium]|nr:hypothetical protein [Patescibacteria group bacterium]